MSRTYSRCGRIRSFHMRHEGPAHQEYGRKIRAKNEIPFVESEIGNALAHVHARIVDENLNLAETAGDTCSSSRTSVLIRYIRGKHVRFTASFSNFRRVSSSFATSRDTSAK